MGAYTTHIIQHITDPDTFWAAEAAGRKVLAASDLTSTHTAHRAEDGTAAYFVDEHESTAAGNAFQQLMSESGAHEEIMGASELQRVFLTGDPDDEARAMVAQFGGSVFETVTD